MDLAARRREFPALDAPSDGPRLAYLDSAATTLVSRAALAATTGAIVSLGNPGRGAYARVQAANDALRDARETVARALGGWHRDAWRSANEVVFTSGTTASVNLVADAWGAENVRAGDVVIVGEGEHHSNFLPWQRVCERTGASLVLAPLDDRGHVDLDAFRALARQHGERTKLVAIAHVGNVLGTVAPIAELAQIAHGIGARVFVDGAQAIAHLDVDVHALGCDFYAFSGHKVYGAPGAGVLWATANALRAPWQLGGGMVSTVERSHATYRDAPARFEAGTPNLPAIASLARALEWTRDLRGSSTMRDDEASVHAALVETIRAAGARILGAPEVGVVSFVWDYHPHDIATIADRDGVALRSGHHCAQLVHRRFGVDASTRASVAMYSGLDDVEQLARALATVREVLGPR